MKLTVDPRAKALIFDIDGTLADTMPYHLQSWQKVGRAYGFEYPPESFYKYAGMSTGKIVAMLNTQGYQLDPTQIIAAKNDSYLQMMDDIQPIEPVFKIVREYYGKLPMALGTGEYRDIALVNLRAAGLEQYFQILVTADDVINPKPDPETFLQCAKLMNISPEYCQVFEDGDLGLEAARLAGMIPTDVRPFL